jgi:putative transposase
MSKSAGVPWTVGSAAEEQAILDFVERHLLDGYRRLTFMRFHQSVVAASPSTVHRVLRAAGRLDRWNRRMSKKGTDLDQPVGAHEH